MSGICADASDELRQGCCIYLFIALMPGMLVMCHLYKPATAARLADGIVAFAGAG